MGPANFFTMENTQPSPTELCTNQTKLRKNAEEGRAEVALPNSSSPLGEARSESGLLEFAPSAGPTLYHSGLAAWAEEGARDGVDRKGSGEEPQEYEAKLQTIFC